MDNSDEDFKHTWLIYFLVGMLVWAIFLKEDKYEDRTAEEWFNEYDYIQEKYDSFRSCVETYDNFDIKTQLDYGGVFYYCE